MVTSAIIKLWGKAVGAVSWEPARRLAFFEYDPDFIRSGLNVAPVMMPLNNASQRIFYFPELVDTATFRGLPGLLADVLPDRYGNRLINAWLQRSGRAPDSLNPVELLCYIGKRGMGALEFEPAITVPDQESEKLEVDSLIRMAQQLLDERTNFHTQLDPATVKAMRDVLKVGTSAGGARAKAIIGYNDVTHEVRSGQSELPKGFSHWIIKFDGISDSELGVSSGYGRVEMAYHRMATACGIEMMECRLLEENGRAHFMTKRFDRGPGRQKLHAQSVCALAHFDFQDINGYSYEQIFQLMRMLHLPYPQAEQLFRRMVFNVILRNCDDHTKNFSFLMDKTGEWRLAPAFDLCHAYRPGSEWVSRQSLSINGKREHITNNDLLEVARTMHIKKAPIIIDQVGAVAKKWQHYAEGTGVSPQLMKAIEATLLV